MPSTTFKRTAGTLGVLAAVLTTAGTASAMPTPSLGEDRAVAGVQFRGEVIGVEPTMKAPASKTAEVVTSVPNVPPAHNVYGVVTHDAARAFTPPIGTDKGSATAPTPTTPHGIIAILIG